jgi:hypothetical protein
MCLDPATLAMLTMAASAAQGVASYAAANQQAKAQADAVNAQNRATQMDLERQASQQREDGAAEANAYAQQARRDMSLLDALVGEGAAGNSADRAGVVQTLKNEQDLATIQNNSRRGQSEIGFSSLASTNTAKQRMAAIQRPSLLQTGLTIAGAGLNYGTTVNKINNPNVR